MIKKLFCSVLFIVVCSVISYAQDTPEELAKLYVKAQNEKNEAAYMKLVHPICVRYYQNTDAEFLSEVFKNVNRHIKVFPNNYEIKIEDETVDKNQKLFFYPVEPTKKCDISWSEETRTSKGVLEKTKTSGMNFSMGFYENKWYIIQPTISEDVRKDLEKQKE